MTQAAPSVSPLDSSAPRLNRNDLRTLALAALGGALEFYDFVVFVFFTKALGQLFFPADMPEWLAQVQVYGIFAAGYLARPLGGIIVAHYGDLLGRKRMFLLSVLLMSVPTLLISFLPTYEAIGPAAPASAVPGSSTILSSSASCCALVCLVTGK